MPVASSDISHLQSVSAGSSGGAVSGSTITSGVKNNVWTDVTDVERVAGGVEYRKTFFKNNHATDSALKPVIYFPVAPASSTLVLGFGINDAADDDPLQGNMTAWSANAIPFIESDGADTRNVTVVGMDNAGTPLPVAVTVALNGTAPVSLVTTFSKVFGFYVASTSASRTVIIKQGSGGTTRGTIGLNRKVSWLWVSAGTAKASGLTYVDLPAGQTIGVWRKLTWIAGAAAVRPNSLTVQFEEN